MHVPSRMRDCHTMRPSVLLGVHCKLATWFNYAQSDGEALIAITGDYGHAQLGKA